MHGISPGALFIADEVASIDRNRLNTEQSSLFTEMFHTSNNSCKYAALRVSDRCVSLLEDIPVVCPKD